MSGYFIPLIVFYPKFDMDSFKYFIASSTVLLPCNTENIGRATISMNSA